MRASPTLCAIKDVHSNPIVGYSLDSRMTADLAVTALRNAVSLRDNPVGVVVHSDRGSQFRSTAFVLTLKKHQLVGSMGRVGACADNAAMQSFFALLQKNVLNRHRWAHTGRATPGDRDLDRDQLPPPTPTTRPRSPHPGRV